ncbi:phenazine biosynthesis protein PhzF, partial [Pseudomonas sp. MPR-R2A7]
RQDGAGLAFAAPPLIRSGPPSEHELAEDAAVLRIDRAAIIDAAWADNGPGWIAILLDSAAAVLAVEPTHSHHRHINIGIVGPHPSGADAAFE